MREIKDPELADRAHVTGTLIIRCTTAALEEHKGCVGNRCSDFPKRTRGNKWGRAVQSARPQEGMEKEMKATTRTQDYSSRELPISADDRR